MFKMDLGSGECGGHIVVALRGELDLLEAPAVATALAAVATHRPRIIVNLADLEFIDASGMAALAHGRRHARDAGGDLLLAGPRRAVQRVLTILWETDGFALHACVAEAAASAGLLPAEVDPVERRPNLLHLPRPGLGAIRRVVGASLALQASRGGDR